ncbi:hypothetical protein EB796_001234 [Bugula neritina]|uniref:Uncharacterized protein n=1 Tax=Bugula neritina TaxID=10212 RepID=A0A7J7KQK6_BUGNE|nr:hypothetical protein EB796_001234 [Bugula neritina]
MLRAPVKRGLLLLCKFKDYGLNSSTSLYFSGDSGNEQRNYYTYKEQQLIKRIRPEDTSSFHYIGAIAVDAGGGSKCFGHRGYRLKTVCLSVILF